MREFSETYPLHAQEPKTNLMQQTTITLLAAYPINGLYSSCLPLLFSRTAMECL